MNSKSRYTTLQREVKNYQAFLLPDSKYRCGWCYRSEKWKMTALGLYKAIKQQHSKHKIVGKILELTKADLYSLDEREIGYSKHRLDWSYLEFRDSRIAAKIDKGKQLYTYVVDHPQPPSYQYPIDIRYLRLCLL